MSAPICKEHGPMSPAPTTSGLDPWLGQWFVCDHTEHISGRCKTRALIPSPALLAQEAELEARHKEARR